ncbi:hypothetical protein ACIBAH_22790 [Streptomyces sp. NPDC051445]|uniref:hypothetical protein n=1 Tax=Streptomyces sp. NPDC051445 TaxID=3365653 RepID=UPI0037A09F44
MGEELFWMRDGDLRHGLAPENEAGEAIARSGFEPCLLAVLRISLGRAADDRITRGWYLGALVRTGHLARAAELAYTISDEHRQGKELLALVEKAAEAGDLCGAQTLAESIPLRGWRDDALVALVAAWARAGERDTAAALAERIRYPHNWGRTWALLAKATADNGDTAAAFGFAARADKEVSSYTLDGAGEVLALLMEVAAAGGDELRAAAFADRVEDFARSHSRTASSRSRPPSLAVVLAREVLRGELDRIDALLRTPARPPVGAGPTLCGGALGGFADQDVALQGDPDDVREVESHPLPTRSFLRARDLARVLDAVAETADQDMVLALADRAETLLDPDGGPDHSILLEAVTLLLAERGHVERAMTLADRVEPGHRAQRQAQIAARLARYGDTGKAEALAHAIDDRRAHTSALVEVVRELARRGDPDRAEALVDSITDRWARGEALIEVVRELARRGDPGRAEALTHSIAYRSTRARALAALAELSEPPRARRLAAQVLLLDDWVTAMPVLERLVPRAVAAVADQMMR